MIVKVEAVTRPESKPATELELLVFAAKYVHGLANEDCVTEWAVVLSKIIGLKRWIFTGEEIY